jgi:hypothetical protein
MGEGTYLGGTIVVNPRMTRLETRTCGACSNPRRFLTLPNGFVQFQIDKDAKLNLLRLFLEDGQAYEFKCK